MRENVYTPGAGNLPPVLAGRDQLLDELSVSLNAVASSGRPHAQDVIVVGPRGVGKTVTLTTYGQSAAEAGSRS
jgi:Cdc6-like AAA superfamily ATPase